MDRELGVVVPSTVDGYSVHRVQYGTVCDNMVGFIRENARIDPFSVLKLSDSDLDWYELQVQGKPVAYAGIDDQFVDADGVPSSYVSFVFAIPGHGYGMRLLRELYCLYLQDPGRETRRMSLTVDPEAKISLFVNYFENLPGWSWWPVRNEWWTSVMFYRDFD